MQAKHSKPNRTVLRIFSTATFLAMIASCSVSAFAGNYDLNNGDVYVEVKNDQHYVSQVTHYNDDGSREYYKDHNGSTPETDNQVTITSNGKETDSTVEIKTDDENQVANVTLKDVNIDARDRASNYENENAYYRASGDYDDSVTNTRSAVSVRGAGTTNIELDGKNTLKGGTAGGAAIRFNDTDKLNKDDPELTKNGTLNINDNNKDDGTLDATSGWCAAIGGKAGKDSGNIVINGGDITARTSTSGNNSAAIGGGRVSQNKDGTVEGGKGTVTINGGTVNANAYAGAAIGGAVHGGANITINGGTVTAKGGVGAGIGSGNGGDAIINITGGTIKEAVGGGGGAGIGSGQGGDANITITGGTIENANGNYNDYGYGNSGSGIGSGSGGNADITISNATIGTATGGTEGAAAGIGGGDATVEIKNSNVTATGSSNGSGVGSSCCGNAKVTIEDSTVNATGGDSGAGVGAANGGDAIVKIKNSTVTGKGSGGIGVGEGGNATVEIKNSTVTGVGSGGIGAGAGGNGNVTIEGGSTITAEGTNYSGISTGTDGTVTIKDSTVIKATGGSRGSGIGTGIAGWNQGSTINIINSKILESLGGVAGIGGGTNTNVSITDKSDVGTVTGTAGVGIGSSGNSSSATIKITGNSHIETVTGNGGAGIGVANGGTAGITIDGSRVDTITGKGGSGIGVGDGSKADVTIKGGTIGSVSGEKGAGIGGGYDATVKILGKSSIGSVTGSTAGIGLLDGQQTDITIDDSRIDSVLGKSSSGIGLRNGGQVSVILRNGSFIGTVTGEGGSGIGSGNQFSNPAAITIDNSTVNSAIGKSGSGIGVGSNFHDKANITVSNGSTIKNAQGSAGNAGIGGGLGELVIDLINSTLNNIKGGSGTDGKGGAGIGNSAASNPSIPIGDTTINIRNTTIENAVGGTGAAGIGGGCFRDANVSISGGNVTATAGEASNAVSNLDAPFAIGSGALLDVDFFKSFSNVTIDGDASDTIVTAIASDLDHAISQLANITVDSLGEAHKVLINMKDSSGTLLKAIHNRAYVGYPADADVDEAHAWDKGVIIREATPEQKGLKRYTCTVDGCGATKEEEYEYVEPAPVEPTDPDTPGTKPGTPAAPDTPADSPVQDTATADTTPADSTVLPGNAQNPDALDGKPGDAAAAQAVQDAKALPQTGSNWLAVLGTALSGLWLMAVGFFLNRKRGENR